MKAVNLIPNDQRPAGKASASSAPAQASGASPFGAYAILGALALAVIASALYALSGNTISENKAQLADIQSQVTTAQSQAGSLQAFADFKNLSDARVLTVKALATSRFSWDQALDDVSRALPSDVFINTFDGTTTSAQGGGSIRGAINAPAIELTGCTASQSSVARLMARLRNVRGVSRVSLSKSDATASTAVAPPVAASSSAAATVTVDGKKAPVAKTYSVPCPQGEDVPTFDVVAFFERAPVSAGAVPNIGAGGVGPTGLAGSPTGPTGTTATTTTPASSTTTTTP